MPGDDEEPLEEEFEGFEDLEFIEPEDFLPANPFPIDSQRMGIDRWSDNAGLIAVAASLNRDKVWHRVAAWILLVVVILPLAMSLLLQFR